ncbi:hypothetical protein MHYP_G00329390 [Metynnis hypsauchen]
MEDEEECRQTQLQNAARRIVGVLEQALESPSQNDGAQVQRGQTSRPGEQAPPGTRQQVVTRQVQLAVSAASGSTRSRVDKNMARAFPGLFKRKATNVKPRKRAVKSRHIQFFLLDKVTERTPKTGEEMVLLQAGMGQRTIDIPEDADHAEISELLIESFPKMSVLNGACLLYKAAGGSGQRKLNVVSPEAEGYSGAHLSRYLCSCCHFIFKIVSKLSKTVTHEVTNDTTEICPICEVPYPIKDLPLHASFCGEGLFSSHLSDHGREPSTSSAVQRVLPNPSPLAPGKNAWKSVQDPQEALQLFLEQLKQEAGSQPSLVLSLDATDSDEQRDGSLIRFYKEDREKSQWTAPFHCIIKGDAALGEGVMRHVLSLAIARLKHGFNLNFGNAAETLLFEEEPEHLVPAASPVLLESDLFRMVGRILGHSVINGGPTLPGLSRAVVSALTVARKLQKTRGRRGPSSLVPKARRIHEQGH